jgi:hypothetical protein
MTHFQYDFSLLNALLDHGRPETHMFHFTVGEMTVTLKDTSLLMGLPYEGEPLGIADISTDWHTEFLAQFANIPRNDHTPNQEYTNVHGPTLTWLHQFSVHTFTSYFSLFFKDMETMLLTPDFDQIQSQIILAR